MKNKGVIPLGFGWYAATEAAEFVVLRVVVPPFVEREGRVGGHDVEQHQVAFFIQQLGVADGVAPFHLVVILAMEKHVHFRQRPCGTDGFLTVEGVLLAVVVFANFGSTLHQQ